MVTEFTIPRNKWVNGNTSGPNNRSALLNKQGNKCCLGHYASTCGVKDSLLLERDIPQAIVQWLPQEMEWLEPKIEACDSVAGSLIRVNDWSKYHANESTREAKIAAMFLEHGVTVKFVD